MKVFLAAVVTVLSVSGLIRAAVALPLAGAAAPAATPLKQAQALARAHAAWPQGRSWLDANKAAVDRAVVPLLDRCLPESSDGEVTMFSIYMRLSRHGRILEVVTDIDAGLGRCLTKQSRELQLPEAPREDFWIRLNLAAET